MERSVDGVRWEIVEVEPDSFHESYFVDVGPSGQIAVSQCRTEARNPGFYCYVDVSTDDGHTWRSFSRVGVGVERVTPHGVLVAGPMTNPASERTWSLYRYDGTIVELFTGGPGHQITVLDDRVVRMEPRANGTELEVDQRFFE